MSISYYQWLTFCILYYLRNIKANGSPCFLIKLVFNAKKNFCKHLYFSFHLSFILYSVFGQTGKFFYAHISMFVTQKACDQDQTSLIGYTMEI